MFNFSPSYVSKHIAIIMLLVCSFIMVLLVLRVKCPFYCNFLLDCSQIHLESCGHSVNMVFVNISLQGTFEVTFEFAIIRTWYQFSSEMRFFLLHGILRIIHSSRIREVQVLNLWKNRMEKVNLFSSLLWLKVGPFSSGLFEVLFQNFNLHWEDKRGFPCLLRGSSQYLFSTPQCHM